MTHDGPRRYMLATQKAPGIELSAQEEDNVWISVPTNPVSLLCFLVSLSGDCRSGLPGIPLPIPHFRDNARCRDLSLMI